MGRGDRRSACRLARRRGELYRFQPPAVPAEDVVNPIGCGDAMAAALAWAIRDGRTMPEAVRLGIGASIDNLRQLLPLAG